MKNRGTISIYMSIVLFAMAGIMSLAVDLTRTQTAATEIRHAVDAAARAGVLAMSKDDIAYIKAQAVYVATQNKVDGAVMKEAEIVAQVGNWNTNTKKFTPNDTPTNAVKVTASRKLSLLLAPVVGRSTATASASAVAMIGGTDGTVQLTPQCNPWLAGMPPGTSANSQDQAGNPSDPTLQQQSPIMVRGLTLVAGSNLTFGPVTGGVLNYPDANALKSQNPDGGSIYDHDSPSDSSDGSEHGMSDLKCPINALIGVFLSDAQPNLSAAPAALDYTSASSRSQATYSPKLKQPFFIGDGLTGTGSGSVQQFKVPAGATRLFLGTMDGYEWSNNIGGMSVKIPGSKSGVLLVE